MKISMRQLNQIPESISDSAGPRFGSIECICASPQVFMMYCRTGLVRKGIVLVLLRLLYCFPYSRKVGKEFASKRLGFDGSLNCNSRVG